MVMNNELERMWRKAIVVYFKALHYPDIGWGTEENPEKRQFE
jgi:hypothetical protein